MRAFVWLTAVFALLYGGYWFAGSRALQGGLDAALAAPRRAGRIDYEALALAGFPWRFDLTVTAPRITSRDRQIGWSAPELRVHALSYRPNHLIAFLPGAQQIRLGRERIALKAADLGASSVFGLDAALPLARAQLVGKALAARSDRGWELALGELRAAIREAAGEHAYDIGLTLFDAAAGGALARLAEANALPGRLERVHLDATLRLDRGLDRFLPPGGPALVAAEIRSIAIDWGEMALDGQGRLTVTPSGTPEGAIDFRIRGWRQALGLLRATGAIRSDRDLAEIERALGAVALLSGEADTLALPLIFAAGQMRLGPVPLGPAPRL